MQLFNIQNSTLAAFIFLFIPLKSNFHCTLPKCGNPSHAVVLERQMGVPFFFLVTCDCKSRILLFLHRLVFLVVVGRRRERDEKTSSSLPFVLSRDWKNKIHKPLLRLFFIISLAFFAFTQFYTDSYVLTLFFRYLNRLVSQIGTMMIFKIY